MSVLTARELDVLRLVAQGLSNPDIARRLMLSVWGSIIGLGLGGRADWDHR